MATEQVFVATPTPTLGRRAIAAPVEFYTTGEDNLRVISVNSLTGVSLKVNARLVTSAGTIDSASWDHTPNTNRTVKVTDFPLAPGAVLNLTIFANAGAPVIGQTFVIAQLIRGLGSAAIVLGVLFSGYVTSTQCLAWPGSPIVSSTEGEPVVRNIIGSAPGPALPIVEMCPTGARWELVTVVTSLTVDANAGTRSTEFRLFEGATIYGSYPANGNQGVNSTFRYSFGQNLPFNTNQFFGLIESPFPQRQFMRAGSGFAVFDLGTGPGDQFTAPAYQVREWLEVG